MMKIASAAAALLFAGMFGAFAADSTTQSASESATASPSDMRGRLMHATKTIQSGINELNEAVNTDFSGSSTNPNRPDNKANDKGTDNTFVMDQDARKTVHSDAQQLQKDLDKLNQDLNQPRK